MKAKPPLSPSTLPLSELGPTPLHQNPLSCPFSTFLSQPKMAAPVEGSGYWLPSEFFDDAATDKLDQPGKLTVDSDSGFCFPAEFPYQIERFEEKRRVMSTSPQAHAWSFSGRSFGSSNPDLIYLAAGQLAKLKLNSVDALRPDTNPGRTGPTKRPNNSSALHNIYGCGMRYGEQQLYRGWPVRQSPARTGRPGSRAVFFWGSGAGSAGTGVFLPRRYGDLKNEYSSDSREGPGYAHASYIPERNLHALNQTNFNPEYDVLMARRNALMLRRERSLLLEGSSRLNRGVCLPRDWTY